MNADNWVYTYQDFSGVGRLLKRRYQKPRKWRPSRDAQKCIACTEDFSRGDKVFTDCAVNIHEECLPAYGEQLKELGLR